MTNEYKYLDEMSLEESVVAFKEELEAVSNNFPVRRKVSWLNSLSVDTPQSKALTMNGYLSGLRDCKIDIGDLKLILEYFLIEAGYV